MIRTTIIGGALFLLPLVVVVFVLGKALEIARRIAQPFQAVIPVDRVAGVAALDVLAILLLVVLCFLAGLLARWSAARNRVGTLDEALIRNVPAYAMIKTIARSVARVEEEAGTLRPVLVSFDDMAQIAFEVERDGARTIVYLPGAPNPWSGSTAIVETARVQPLAIASHEATKLMQVLGHGTLGAIDAPPRDSAAGP